MRMWWRRSSRPAARSPPGGPLRRNRSRLVMAAEWAAGAGGRGCTVVAVRSSTGGECASRGRRRQRSRPRVCVVVNCDGWRCCLSVARREQAWRPFVSARERETLGRRSSSRRYRCYRGLERDDARRCGEAFTNKSARRMSRARSPGFTDGARRTTSRDRRGAAQCALVLRRTRMRRLSFARAKPCCRVAG